MRISGLVGVSTYTMRVFLRMARFDILRVGSIDVGKFQTEVGHHLVEQARRSAVEIIAANDMIAGLQHGDDGVDRGHAAGEYAGSDSAFERGKILLRGARAWDSRRGSIRILCARRFPAERRSRLDRSGR